MEYKGRFRHPWFLVSMAQDASISLLQRRTRFHFFLCCLLFIAVFLRVAGPFNIGSEGEEHSKASGNFTSLFERQRVLTSEMASLLADNRHMKEILFKEILSKEQREGRGTTNGARSADSFNVSTDTTKATRDALLFSQEGDDGMGHQMLGIYSSMLLPLVDDRFQYVRKEHIRSSHTTSKQLVQCFDVLQCNASARSPPPSPTAMLSDFGKFLKIKDVMASDFGNLTAAMLSDFGQSRTFKDVVQLDIQFGALKVICGKNRTSCELGMRTLSISSRSCF